MEKKCSKDTSNKRFEQQGSYCGVMIDIDVW